MRTELTNAEILDIRFKTKTNTLRYLMGVNMKLFAKELLQYKSYIRKHCEPKKLFDDIVKHLHNQSMTGKDAYLAVLLMIAYPSYINLSGLNNIYIFLQKFNAMYEGQFSVASLEGGNFYLQILTKEKNKEKLERILATLRLPTSKRIFVLNSPMLSAILLDESIRESDRQILKLIIEQYPDSVPLQQIIDQTELKGKNSVRSRIYFIRRRIISLKQQSETVRRDRLDLVFSDFNVGVALT